MSSTSSRLRTFVVRLTVASFGTAALLGIGVLLRGGEIGELEGRVLMTTLLMGVVSVAVLCYATPRARFVGGLGGAVVVVPLVTGLLLIWRDEEPFARSLETFATGALVSALLAQVCLLWSAAGDIRSDHRLLRSGLFTTLVSAVAFVALWMPVIWVREFAAGDWYFRLVGVVGILDVLGTVVIPACVLLLRGRTPRSVGEAWVDVRSDRAPGHGLPEDLWKEIDEVAASSGRPADDVVREAVRRHREELVAAGAIHDEVGA